MSGANTDLGFKLNSTKSSDGTKVDVVIEAKDPTSTTIKGLLLWATDKEGKNLGTWKAPTGFKPVDSCKGGAVAHVSKGVKALDNKKSITGFQLSLSSPVQGAIDLRAVIVGGTRYKWQFLKPVNVQGGIYDFSHPVFKSRLCAIRCMIFQPQT
jgi:hypothetical protein